MTPLPLDKADKSACLTSNVRQRQMQFNRPKPTVALLSIGLIVFLSGCIIPVPVPKTRTERGPWLELSLAKVYLDDGVIHFVDRESEHTMQLSLKSIASKPFNESFDEFTVVSVENLIGEVEDVSLYELMTPVRFYANWSSLQYYTYGSELREDLDHVGRIKSLPIEEHIKGLEVTHGEEMAIFALPSVWKSEGNIRGLFLIRSTSLLPNGSQSALFQLTSTTNNKLGIAFPVIGPDVINGGVIIDTTP